MTIIERLKKYIQENNKTQHDIVILTGATTTTINRWLKNKAVPSYAWEKILDILLTKEGY